MSCSPENTLGGWNVRPSKKLLGLLIAAHFAGNLVGNRASASVDELVLQQLGGLHPDTELLVQTALENRESGPDAVLALTQAGSQLLADGHAAQGLQLLQLALEIHPNDFELNYLAAYAAELLWQSDSAIAYLSKAMPARASYAPGWLRLGTHGLQLGDLELTQLSLRAAEDLGELGAYGWYLKGQLAMQQQNWPVAAQHYRQALRVQPGANAIYAALAQALIQAGDSAGAERALARRGPVKPGLEDEIISAVLAHSNSFGQLSEAGGRALESGSPDQAVQLLERALSVTDQPPPQVAFNLGLAYYALGRPDDSVSALQMALELNPDYTKAHLQLARVLGEQGASSEAQTHYERALALEPENYAGRVNYSNLLRRQQDWQAALPHYQWMISTLPAQRNGYLGAAQCLDGLQDEAGLARLLDSASRRFPADGVLFEYRLRFIASRGDGAAEASHLEQANNLFAQNPSPGTMETLAMVHAALGEFERAVALMEEKGKRLDQMGRAEDALGLTFLSGFSRQMPAQQPGIARTLYAD